jgi:hypothetical protein
MKQKEDIKPNVKVVLYMVKKAWYNLSGDVFGIAKSTGPFHVCS